MSLDASYVGRRFSSETSYEVGREKIREFADAIGDPHPVYRDPEAAKSLGYRDVIAPPTFPIVFTFAASRPLFDELGIELSQLVHGDQRFRYVRPLHPGDRLRCEVVVENVRALGDSHILTLRTEAVGEGGEHVLTAWSTLVVR